MTVAKTRRTFVVHSTSVVIPGSRTKQCGTVNSGQVGNYCGLIRRIQISCDNRSLVLHCSRQLRDGYMAPRFRGSIYSGCPIVTEAVNSIYGSNAAICLAPKKSVIEKSVGFMGVFERARDRLGQNPSPSQRKSFGTHARLFTEAETGKHYVVSCMHGADGDNR